MRLNGNITVPSGWGFAPLKRLTRFGYGEALAADDRDANGSVKVYGSNGPFDQHSSGNTLGPCIIVGRKGSYGKCQYSEQPVFAVDTTFVIDKRHTGADLRYLFHLLGILGLDELSDDTAVPGLSREKAYQSLAPLPPLESQRRIAAFLDEKTAQIDGLIARKQALLERLAEKRQAIITQAVTKGLNPAAPMKDSGIEWFGQIPAHWEVKRLNSFCDFQSGKAHEPFIDPEGAYVCVNARFISTNGEVAKRCTENLSPATPGDILMVMSDLPNGRALARTFLVDDRDAYAVNQRVCRIRPHRGDARYFSHQLNRNPQLLRHDDGNEQTHLPNAAFKQLLLLEPPTEEQQQIVALLENTLDKLDALKLRVDASLDKLAEYRSALITAAVTGQIEGLQ